jgi:hypothetical protein
MDVVHYHVDPPELRRQRRERRGTQNMLCAILAAAVLVGLAANTLFGLWWLDPAVALAISGACVHEGQKAWRGEECGCATCV